MVEQELNELKQRIQNLEKTIENFMKLYGPEVQEKRKQRDEVWDEMVRVV